MPENRRQSFSIQILQLIDAVLVWLAFWLATLLREPVIDLINIGLVRFGIEIFKQGLHGLSDITWLLFVVVPFSPLCLELFGFYRNPLQQRAGRAFWHILQAFVVIATVVGLFAYLSRQDLASRATLGIATTLAFSLLMARSYATTQLAKVRSRHEGAKESVVIAGKPDDIDAWLAALKDDSTAYWRIVGRHDLSSDDWDSFQRLLHDQAVQRVIFAARHTEFSRLATAIEMCEVRGVEAWISAGFMQTQVARPTFDMIGGKPMLVLRSTPDLSWELLAKDVIDRVAALGLLMLSLPLWIVTAVLIKIQSPGPVFYRQERAGRYGRPFRMWKFRSMIVDADKKLEEIKNQSGNQMSGPVFKLENDPRIFPFGHFIRKYSIDEMPQFINVLMGEMSLVGPRPMAMYELPKIERSEHRRKLSVKPGLTCIWQVSGRNSISSFDEWVALDLKYIDNWSLWLDFKILLQTIPAVLWGKGAK